ncbi:MAG: DNA/RNA helicase domain-containing protein [Tannerellaceae bacterium]
MIVFQASKVEFHDAVFQNQIDAKIHEAFQYHLGRKTSPSELHSWRNSMKYMDNLLYRTDIPDDTGVSIEFQIPLTSKRIDFILTGKNEQKRSQMIIIELKQWETARKTNKDAIVSTYFQGRLTETAHPSYQAWSYAQLLSNFSETVENNDIDLIPCAYLHNYEPDDVINNSFYQDYIEKAPAFLKTDASKLKEFIERYIKYGDNNDILYLIENGRIRPSKQLADSLSSMLKGNKEFTMIDDQKLVYETALDMAAKASESKKQVLIVEGGPGTGKSVVAINLLVELTQKGLVTQYVTKNSAPREVYIKLLTKSFKKSVINNLFKGSGAFYDSESNSFDALIVDEAHRLNMKSGLFQNKGENQAKEIIAAAKFSIFFVDDDQQIHIKDIGNKRQLEKWAKELKANVVQLKLESQFRCNGADGYLAWLDNTLQIRDTANFKLSTNEYDFQIFDNPTRLYECIKEKNKANNKSRMVAGYCWDWKSKKDKNNYDIEFPEYDFRMQWNLNEDGASWIIAENSIKQIGCIHTCQGLELDYVGVIIGEDLRYEDGKVICDISKRSTGDASIKGFKSRLKVKSDEARQEIDAIIRNTYRTLLTRGMKGCYIYCCDKNLSNYFAQLIHKENFDTAVVQLIDESEEKSIRVEADVNNDVKFVDYLPLYTLKAACGAFTDYQQVEEEGWVKVAGLGRLHRGMFVIQATGNSMQPRINDGDFCVFKANVVGSRNNKIVLVQHYSYYDSEAGGCYSIKRYSSEKLFDSETGEWQHERIILNPDNKDYDPIIIQDEEGYAVIGEFIGVVHV